MSNSVIDSVIAQAQGNIGYQEGANNDNKFAATAKHPNHQPWCATFIVAVFSKAGALGSIKNSSSCIEIAKWAKTKKVLFDVKEAKRGDLILMNFSGSKVPEHIGLAVADYDSLHKAVLTIEGNTGDASQVNGDGVYRKIRGEKFIVGVVRPLWS